MIKRFIYLFCNLGLLLMTAQLHAQIVKGDRISLIASLAEDIVIAGDYTQVGIYARRNEAPSDVKVAYLELFSSSGEAVVQEMGYLEKGIGNIPLHIPESLPSGYYLFRSYTSDSDWNNEASYYHSWLAIINPDDPPLVKTAELPSNISFHSKGILELDQEVYAKKEQVQLKLSPNDHKSISFLSVKQLLSGIDMPKDVLLEEQHIDNPKFRENRELHGHIMKILNVMPGDQVFLSSMGRYKEMYFAEPGEDGTAYIFMDSKRSFDDLILQSSLQAQSGRMEVSSPFWEIIPKVKDWPILEMLLDLRKL